MELKKIHISSSKKTKKIKEQFNQYLKEKYATGKHIFDYF